MLALLENLITPRALIMFNIVIILSTGLIGGGLFLANSGLMDAIGLVFVLLIIIRIFSAYSYSDYILKGFLKIQLAFLLLLGVVQVYEYIGLYALKLETKVVEFSATTSYVLWVVGVLLALEFVYHIYYKRSLLLMAVLSVAIFVMTTAIVASNVFEEFANNLPLFSDTSTFLVAIVLGIVGIFSIVRIRTIMPIFREFSYYIIPAILLLIVTVFAETHDMFRSGVLEVQSSYVAHLVIYATLSLIIVGIGKLKRPQGIYAEM